MAEKAKQIYEEFIQTEAPKEVGTGGGQVAECIHLRVRSAHSQAQYLELKATVLISTVLCL